MKIISLFTATILAGGLFALEYIPSGEDKIEIRPSQQFTMSESESEFTPEEEKELEEIKQKMDPILNDLKLLWNRRIEINTAAENRRPQEYTPEEQKEIKELEAKSESILKNLQSLWKRQMEIFDAADARQGASALS